MVQVSFYTTVLRPDAKLTRTHESLAHSGVDYEHVVTVAQGFDQVYDYLPATQPNLKVISTPHATLGAGFNAAIQHCDSANLMVVNSGDTIVNAKPLVDALDHDATLDFVYGDIRFEDRIEPGRPSPVAKRDFLVHGMYLRHGAIMTRRCFHRKFGTYDPRLRIAVDFDMYLKAVAAGARMRYVPEVVAAIETPGLSRRLWERTQENYRVIRRWLPWPIAFPIACKWLLASLLFERLWMPERSHG
jgi:hypothetical protein